MNNRDPRGLADELAAIELGIRIETPELAEYFDSWEWAGVKVRNARAQRPVRRRRGLARVWSAMFAPGTTTPDEPAAACHWHDTATVLPSRP